MAVNLARFRVLKEALVASGGDDRLIFHLYGGIKCAFIAEGIPDADVPGAPIGLGANALDVSAQAEKRRFYPRLLQNLTGPLRGVALANAAEIDLLARPQGDAAALYADAIRPHQGKKVAQFRRCGDMVALVIKAPEPDQWVYGGVKQPPGGIIQLQRLLQQGQRLLGKRRCACLIQPGDFAARQPCAEKAVQVLNFRLGQIQPLLPVGAVSRQGHDGIHGGQVAGGGFVLFRTAPGQQQKHR